MLARCIRVRVRVLLTASLLLAVPALAAGQQLLRTHNGLLPGDGSGLVQPAGDVNHDGHPDLIIGAPHHATSAGADTGSARVVSGSNGATLFTLNGIAAGDLFGSSCGAAGDVDGDGYGDVVVGAPGSPGSGAPGYVSIYSGASGALLRTIAGDQPGGAFGAAVSGGRDLNGDGTPDLVVGAPLQDHGGTDTGSAYAFSGADGSPLGSINGPGGGDMLGGSVSVQFAGLQVTDNAPGVIIGCTQGGNGGPGYAISVSPGSFTVLHTFGGAAAGDAFGRSVAIAGDIDGDGTPDILVGSDPHGVGGAPGTGYARAYSGATSALLLTIGGATSGSGAGTAAGIGAGTGFATVVAGVGDVNGDGRADIAVGEPLANDAGAHAGAVHVYSGATGGELYDVNGSGPGQRFGAALAFAGDVSGDGLADFAAGAPGDGVAGAGAGSAYVLSLTRWQDLGAGMPGVNGIPRLTGTGGLVALTQASLSVSSARAISGAGLVLGYSLHLDTTAAGGAGALVPTPDIVTTGLLTNAIGELDYNFAWPAGVPSGFTVYYQFVINDPAAPGGQARSNTVAAIVP